MAMSTQSASALTKASRRLKSLASDAISVPDTATLAQRKSEELAAAMAKLDKIIAEQIALEAAKNGPRVPASLLADKAKQEALIERLRNESGLLKEKLRAENPPPKLTPEQMRAQLFVLPPVSAKDPAKVAAVHAARAEVAAVIRDIRLNGETPARLAAKREAELKTMVLESPVYDRGQCHPYTLADFVDAKKKVNK